MEKVSETGKRFLTFGKYCNKTIEEVYRKDRSYLEWMVRPSTDFHNKEIVSKVRKYLDAKDGLSDSEEERKQSSTHEPVSQERAEPNRQENDGAYDSLRKQIISLQSAVQEGEKEQRKLRGKLKQVKEENSHLRSRESKLVPLLVVCKNFMEQLEKMNLGSSESLAQLISNLKIEEGAEPREEATQKK